MKQKIIAVFLFALLVIPATGKTQSSAVTTKENIVGRIVSMIKESIGLLEKLFAIHQRQSYVNLTGSIIQKISPVPQTQLDDCDNYEKICSISPFGTSKKPALQLPTSTIPQVMVKYVAVSGNMAKIVYSVSDIQDNETALRINYGTSSSTLDNSTPYAKMSYGITGVHGIDDADFMISAPPESVCLYVDGEEISPDFPEYTALPLYNPDVPTYYLRFEAQNDLGTFFTPSLELLPFSFQFDNFCGEATYDYENGELLD